MTHSVIGSQHNAQHCTHCKFFLECKVLPMLCNVSLWKMPVSDRASASAMNTPFADAPSHYYGTLFWSRKEMRPLTLWLKKKSRLFWNGLLLWAVSLYFSCNISQKVVFYTRY